MFRVRFAGGLILATALSAAANAQTAPPQSAIDADPAAKVERPVLESSVHQPLPEQFIWLATPAGTSANTDVGTPRYFRVHLAVDAVPAQATLYIAGPDHVRAYVNGTAVATSDRDPRAKTSPLVVILGITPHLRNGENLLAIEAQGGSPLAVKIMPASQGVIAPSLLISGPGWKATLNAQEGWEQSTYDDSAWSSATPLGSIDTAVVDLRPQSPGATNLQWNWDSEMFRWPGYDGISPYLAHLPILAVSLSDVAEGAGHFQNVSALAQVNASAQFEVQLPKEASGPLPAAPSLVLDFGRETNGRLEVTSDSNDAIALDVQYGESREEALKSPYLGTNELLIPAHGTGYGPKSSFRYAQVKFLAFNSRLRFKSIRVDAIYYPVQYRASFESSDPMLNRIWAIGAYTSHLCMQDDIWDAPKRDRGPWMGDLDVSGDVIDTVFADRFLMQETMDRLIAAAGNPVVRDVNEIPGYSAFWVMGEADYYRHSGDSKYLATIREPLVRLLDYMSSELDAQNLFVNGRNAWPFVDWSPDYERDTAEARRATQFEFYRAFSDGAWLLREAGDSATADKYQARAQALRDAAQHFLLDQGANTFGSRWQANAMAIYSGVADREQTAAIWDRVLSQPSQFMITPYYNYYVISAMAQAGHRRAALDWIRQYWGGMIAEGATSFWEGYDPSWPKQDFHSNLQADDDKGYFVSLAHGWSSGPTAWLAEQILGIRPIGAGFRETMIRPDLAGLEWAGGAVPAPSGLIRVNYKAGPSGLDAQIEVPEGIKARISMPICAVENSIILNGNRTTGEAVESATRAVVSVEKAGHYVLHSNCAASPSQ